MKKAFLSRFLIISSISSLLLSPIFAFSATKQVILPHRVQKNTISKSHITSIAHANQINIDKFLQAIEKNNKNNASLGLIKEQIRKDSATTTSFVVEFMKQVNTGTLKKPPLKNAIISLVYSLFGIEEAYAATGLPFGGPILYAFPCTCSTTWLTLVGPTSNLLTSAKILDYQPGSQAFASYNLPFAPYVLGNYVLSAPTCYMYVGVSCSPVYTDGLITPLVGSSIL